MSITASIVSHGHGDCLRSLLSQLIQQAEPRLRRVIVTLNVPESVKSHFADPSRLPFELRWLENAQAQGFSANHNQAFALDRQIDGGSAWFAVLNPDLVLRDNPFPALLVALEQHPRAALAYPRQLDRLGQLLDHERRVPTLARLLRRHLLRQRLELKQGQRADWVNGAFLLLRSQAFGQLGGFDEGYHMYCEDVDLCLRLQLAGWSLQAVPDVVVEHVGQHASHRPGAHLRWHVASLRRLWKSDAWCAWHQLVQNHDQRPRS